MASPHESDNLATALRYIALIEQFAEPAAFEGILHPDALLEEYPNLLMKHGSRRDYAALIAGPQQGRKILSDNRYEVTNAFASGDWVTVEMVWTGTLAIPLGNMPAGAQLEAHIATILRFQDSMIISQRQYDCYKPLPEA